eukprot:maker-scaffold273_size229271-snap-gene-1.18 protein:Tk00746 transcript:maker-scaffold273_size229271-snap-gene-1.18-mRNA-1 annotation:"hypothetical protein FOMPIDRAFT_1029454"
MEKRSDSGSPMTSGEAVVSSCFEVRPIPGKGLGVVATRNVSPGTLLIDEGPLLLLDPPCKRNDILKLLGCRLFSSINMRSTPDRIRAQIHQMILEKLVQKLDPDQLRLLYSLTDKSDESSGSRSDRSTKSLWGIWQTNSIPLGSYRVSGIFPTVVRLNHSCRPNAHHIWDAESGREQVWVVGDIRAGQEITISYVRTFCSKKFRQSLLMERFGFLCSCEACSMEGMASELDDKYRLEIDRLAQQFSISKQEEELFSAIEIGERMIYLMHQVGFNANVLWPGFFNCFELYLLVGDLDKARFYLTRAYELVCKAQGPSSADARTMSKYKHCPEQYLQDFKTSDQHFIATLTHC